jgi:cysteinyl-tRNA synthetase
MSELHLFDTLSRTKRLFKPIKAGEVAIYACGPTVYSPIHIGNLSTFIFVDTLIRYLKYGGYNIHYVRNITDVGHLTSDQDEGEDKLENASKSEGLSPSDIAQKYIDSFHKDTENLNLLKPDFEPRATEYIDAQIAAVRKLLEKNLAYETDTAVYFDTTTDPEYGSLAMLDSDSKSQVSRINASDKKNPRDFALWIKAVGKHAGHMQNWDTPWGKGFPGWHLECSVMAQSILGARFDIHCGGIDLASTHHMNEIAQSRALYGQIPANFWLHKELMHTKDSKMSRSKGNYTTLTELTEAGFGPAIFRLYVLSAHHRSKTVFLPESMDQAKNDLTKILKFTANIDPKKPSTKVTTKILKSFWLKFESAMDDDLNTPLAISEIHALIKNLWAVDTKIFGEDVADAFVKLEDVLGLKLFTKQLKLSTAQYKLIKGREDARRKNDYKTSDEIRKVLELAGIILEDLPDGSTQVKFKN